MISESLLLQYNGTQKKVLKGDFIFKSGQEPLYFYQLVKGTVKMNNFNSDGKEFIQGIFRDGQSFGEPPLFCNLKYPANAEAIHSSTIWLLPKKHVLQLLSDHPEIHLMITENLAKRLHYKATMISEISSQNPEHRLLKLLTYLKTHVYKLPESDLFEVNLTRQQLADLCGLRVETVIRTFKVLENKNLVHIKDHKIYI